MTMQPTFGMRCIQHVLLAFNALFTLTGVILISVGSSVNNIYSEYATFLESRFYSPSLMIMSVGVLVFIIAAFGCYSALKLSVAAMMIYSVMLMGIFGLEMVAGITGYFLEDQIEDILSRTLNETLRQYPDDAVAAAAVDTLQNNLVCCGLDGPADWKTITPSDQENVLKLPESCCAIYEHNVCVAVKGIGCLDQLQFLLAQCSILFTGTILIIALIQLLGVMFSCKLAKELRHQKYLRDRVKWEVKETIKNSYPSVSEDKTASNHDYILYNKV